MRLKKLLAFLEESPQDPFLLFAIAKEHEKLDQLPEALEYFARLVRNHPDYVGTYYHYGKLLESLERSGEALDMYARGMEVARNQGDQHALSELAGARMSLEE